MSTRVPWRWGIAAAWAALPFAGGLAEAAEEHAAHAGDAPSVLDLFFPVVNFTIFAYLFSRYAWPGIRGALAERRKRIERELAEASVAEREAEGLLREIEARRGRLADDAKRLVAELRAEGERERAAVVEAARKSGERARRDARLLAEQESARVAARIRAEIAARVTEHVAGVLRERLDAGDQERLVREFLAGVGPGARS